MRHLIESHVSEEAFAECWPDKVPPYDAFLDSAGEKLSGEMVSPVAQFFCSIRAWGDNRVRLDGQLRDASGDKTFYVEQVWLPRSGTFRGSASVWDPPPPPEPKSIEQFIGALDAIVGEDELAFEGQAYDAVEGVDEAATDLSRAFPAVFGLFERFPEEDFGNPGVLVHLMEAHRGYEDLLRNSLRRIPSISAVTMVNRILNSSLPDSERSLWVSTLQGVADSDSTAEGVRNDALQYIEYQAPTSTEL